jgi:hypothetical protein
MGHRAPLARLESSLKFRGKEEVVAGQDTPGWCWSWALPLAGAITYTIVPGIFACQVTNTVRILSFFFLRQHCPDSAPTTGQLPQPLVRILRWPKHVFGPKCPGFPVKKIWH